MMMTVKMMMMLKMMTRTTMLVDGRDQLGGLPFIYWYGEGDSDYDDDDDDDDDDEDDDDDDDEADASGRVVSIRRVADATSARHSIWWWINALCAVPSLCAIHNALSLCTLLFTLRYRLTMTHYALSLSGWHKSRGILQSWLNPEFYPQSACVEIFATFATKMP